MQVSDDTTPKVEIPILIEKLALILTIGIIVLAPVIILKRIYKQILVIPKLLIDVHTSQIINMLK